jgi:site-specific DNA-cytosine methylase
MTLSRFSGMTAVSLFDGIGGFPEALRRNGIRTVATVEIDKAAAGVTATHFPDAHQFDDVTQVTADEILAAGFTPVRGILTGGWPCQDLSMAGRRLGLGGARSRRQTVAGLQRIADPDLSGGRHERGPDECPTSGFSVRDRGRSGTWHADRA